MSFFYADSVLESITSFSFDSFSTSASSDSVKESFSSASLSGSLSTSASESVSSFVPSSESSSLASPLSLLLFSIPDQCLNCHQRGRLLPLHLWTHGAPSYFHGGVLLELLMSTFLDLSIDKE